MTHWMLEPSQQRIHYMMNVFFTNTVAGYNYNKSFQTEISLLEMQRLDKRLKERNPNLFYIQLPEEDLIYRCRPNRDYEIDERHAEQTRDTIKEYLICAFNDPAYYCPALFQLIRGFRAIQHLKSLEGLFDGSLAHREKLMRESGIEVEEASRQSGYVQSRSYSPRFMDQAPAAVQNIYSNTLRPPSLGFITIPEPVAGTGEGASFRDRKESKEFSEAGGERISPLPPSNGPWWDNDMQIIFDMFLGIRIQINTKDSRVTLDRDSKLMFIFTL